MRGTDKRGHRRYPVHGARSWLRYSFEATIQNLSVDGMAVETSHWLHVGRRYAVRIQAGDRQLTLEGEVVWCHLKGTERRGGDSFPLYAAGFVFRDAPERRVRELIDLIEETGQIDLSTRISGQFQVRREEAVEVAYRRDFVVREISPAELVIEADLLPEPGARFDVELGNQDGAVRATVRVSQVEPVIGDDGRATSRIVLQILGLGEAGRARLRQIVKREVEEGELALPFRGNPKSRLFHAAACARGGGAGRLFSSRDDAIAAGFRPATCCKP